MKTNYQEIRLKAMIKDGPLKEGENKFQAQCKSGHDFGHDQCSRG